jgi:hypothetical protein
MNECINYIYQHLIYNLQIELDDYYGAIKMYVLGNGYPPHSNPSFKRLIRDQARHFVLKDDELYHEVGNKKELKKVVMTKEDRLKLLTQTHLKTSSKIFSITLS